MPKLTLGNRFWKKVKKRPDGCWEWMSAKKKTGYGVYHMGGKYGPTRRAHRLAYRAKVGPIPEGLELDHLCCNRWCVNPDHLEAVTHAENLRRGKGKPRKISDAQVEEIRSRYAGGRVTQTVLADQYGISQTHVSDIVRGEVR